MALKYPPDIGNYPVYNNVPGALYFLKSFKCVFAAAQTKQMILRRLEVKRMTDLKAVSMVHLQKLGFTPCYWG